MVYDLLRVWIVYIIGVGEIIRKVKIKITYYFLFLYLPLFIIINYNL